MLGLDPGIRTGCKLAVVDATGKLLETATIYPFQPRLDVNGSIKELRRLIDAHGVELVAIGNGTASRESDQLMRVVIEQLGSERRVEKCKSVKPVPRFTRPRNSQRVNFPI